MAQSIAASRSESENPTICDTFQGYPTSFDQNIKDWVHLSTDLSLIDVLIPPSIMLKHFDGACYQVIPLAAGFQYVKQSNETVLLIIANTTYGFGFIDEKTRLRFEAALAQLTQYHKSPFNKPIPAPRSPSVSSQEKSISPDKRPDVRPKRVNEAFANKDPDEVNELIAQRSNKDHQEETLCVSLSEAIEAGDIKKAQDIVAQLAKQKAKLTAIPILKEPSKMDVSIQIESKDDYETPPIKVSVDPLVTTVGALKEEIQQKYDLPIPTQRLIIKKRLAGDDELVVPRGAKEMETIYLYLKAIDDTTYYTNNSKEIQTETVNISRLQYEQNQQNNYMAMDDDLYEYGISQSLQPAQDLPTQNLPKGNKYGSFPPDHGMSRQDPYRIPSVEQGYMPNTGPVAQPYFANQENMAPENEDLYEELPLYTARPYRLDDHASI